MGNPGWRVAGVLVAVAVVSSMVVPVRAAAQPPPTHASDSHKVPIATRSVPASQPITFYFGLARRDVAAQQTLLSVSTPGSGQYGRHYTKRQVRSFGASAATVRRTRLLLRQRGLAGILDRSRIFMRVRGSAAAFEQAFRMELVATVYTGYTVVSPRRAPRVPRELRLLAPDRVWMSETQNTTTVPSPPPPEPPPAPMTPLPANTGTPVRYCPLFDDLGTSAMTFQQAMIAYGMAGIKRDAPATRGDVSARYPVGILAMGSGYSASLLAYAQECFGWTGKVRRARSDGMTSPLAPGGEGNLDIQMVGAIASKGWTIPFYEGLSSNNDPGQFLPASVALNDRRTPSVLSVSYGDCETNFRGWRGTPIRRIADAVFVHLGLVGTSVMVAAGDAGSSVCKFEGEEGGLTVSYPGTSPWVTSVGGSQIALSAANSRRSERVWNSWRNSVPGDPTLPVSPTAGTGGPSAIYPRPVWQRGIRTGTSRRAVPDVTAHAAFGPDWPVFSGGLLQGIAGTSASTPFTAGGIALINSRRMARAQPTLGFLNPLIYRIPARTFFDVTAGTNDLWGVGCCRAKKGYDMASGRGAIKFNQLARSANRLLR